MATSRFYRCRIHDGVTALATFTNPSTAGGNALVVTSARGGTAPYIAEPPSGDGQSIDPITGKSEIGEYHVRVVDHATSATSRVVTSVLADAAARWQLLSRRAVVETSTDGATWTTLVLGYLNRLTLPGALVWDLTIGETRRAELRAELFRRVGAPSNTGGVLTSPSCLLGGPIRAGAAYNTKATAFAGVQDFGPARFQVVSVAGANAKQLALAFVGGWLPPYYAALYTGFKEDEAAAVNLYARDGGFFAGDDQTWAYGSGDWNVYGSFPGLVAQLTRVSTGAVTECTPLAFPAKKRGTLPLISDDDDGPLGAYDHLIGGEAGQPARLAVHWDTATMGAKPAVGTQFDVVVYPAEPSERFPLHERGHPMDLVTTKCTALGIPYDATAAATLRTAINTAYGGAVVCELTWTEPQKFSAYAQQLLAFFGVGLRVSPAGALQPFGIRHAAPDSGQTITLADLRDAETDIFDLDEASIVTTVEQKTREYLFTRATRSLVETGVDQYPLDNLRAAWRTLQGATDDTIDAGDQRTHSWELPGRVLVDGKPQDLAAMAQAAGDWLVGWRRRGVSRFALRCLPNITAQAGDQVLVDVPHQPVAVVGASPVTQRGQAAIAARVLRRTETPAGPDLECITAPPLDQAPLTSPLARADEPDVAIVPTITVAPSASDATRVVLVELTNAQDLADAKRVVLLEYRVSAAEPTGSGQAFGPFDPADATSTPVRYALPAASPADKVWVRARSQLATGGVLSNWSAWTSATLEAAAEIPDPTQPPTVQSRTDYPATGVGRLYLTVADPAGRIITGLQVRTKSGTGAWGGWSTPSLVAGEYLADVALVEGQTSSIQWVLTYLDSAGVTQPLGDVADFQLAVIPAVLSVDVRPFGKFSGIQTSAQASARIIVDEKAKSVRVAASKTGIPSAATVASSPALAVPAGTRTVTTDALLSLTFDETVYVAAIAYTNADGTGTPSALASDDWLYRYASDSSGEIPRTRVDAATAYSDTAKSWSALQTFNAGLAASSVAVAGGGALSAAGAWGSFTATGSAGGYGGFYFTDVGRYLMVSGTDQGIWTGTAWQWSFTNGVLSNGTVPAARVNPGTLPVGQFQFVSNATGGAYAIAPLNVTANNLQEAAISFTVNGYWGASLALSAAGLFSFRNDNGAYAQVRTAAFFATTGDFSGALSAPSATITGTVSAASGNFGNGLSVGGNAIGGHIISTDTPSGTAPEGTMWDEVSAV